jgi:hypothetical protein
MEASVRSTYLQQKLPKLTRLSAPAWQRLDEELSRRQAEAEAKQGNLRPWIEANLWIRTKDRLVRPLLLNWAQADYWSKRTERDIILKARQMGFTTLTQAGFFADCLLRPNTTSVVVAHDLDSTEQIFQIAQLFWERLPASAKATAGKPKYENRREFFWPQIGSRFFVGTAGNVKFGRGQTIHNLHCSEFAFWPNPEEGLAALMEAVPAGGRVVIESTANGIGNRFHRLWLGAKGRANGWKRHCYGWFESEGYTLAGPPLGALAADEAALRERYHLTDDQIRWRRAKQRDLGEKFRQEYPENYVDCFLASARSIFDMTALRKAIARIAADPPGKAMAVLATGDASISLAPARLVVWKQPQDGVLYVVGADVGEGLERGDASAAVVLERATGEQVAELHGRVPPDRFAHLLAALGRHYNSAEIAVERNNHGHSTLNTLFNVCRYRQLYYHLDYDQGGKAKPTLGWPTDQKTKPILVDDLAAAIVSGGLLIRSAELADECQSFVQTNSGQEAQAGAFDDRVIAAGIAWQARKRRVTYPVLVRPPGL